MNATGIPQEMPSAGAAPAQEASALPDFLGGEKLEDGIGLCLSGGGFRAMLFHLGAFVRLNEVGLLGKIDRVASVSGGSIAAGALAVAWNKLTFDGDDVATNLLEEVAAPILKLADKCVDVPAILLGLLPFVSAAGRAAAVYDKVLFHGKSLQELPSHPRFSFTATSLQSGVLWRFAKDYAADWRVGRWDAPNLPIAAAVAASAAFPPYLSPAYVDVPKGAIVAQPGGDLSGDGFTSRLRLTDGGIYDNLALEPVWKRYRTILVSDGGAVTPASASVKANWLSLATRATDIALQQGINMRRRVLLGLQRSGERKMAYWGITDGIDRYGVDNPLGFTSEETRRAALVPTRLTRFSVDIRTCVLRAGYAHADAALRGGNIPLPNSRKADFSALPAVL